VTDPGCQGNKILEILTKLPYLGLYLR